jgi:hypothetical protein
MQQAREALVAAGNGSYSDASVPAVADRLAAIASNCWRWPTAAMAMAATCSVARAGASRPSSTARPG